jgi:hypothetical protein
MDCIGDADFGGGEARKTRQHSLLTGAEPGAHVEKVSTLALVDAKWTNFMSHSVNFDA